MSKDGDSSGRFWQAMFFWLLLVFGYMWMNGPSSPPQIPPTGATNVSTTPDVNLPITVKIANPEVKTALARVVETNETDTLDQEKLTFSACWQGQHISVWAPGYYINTFQCTGNSPFEYPVVLESINIIDNPNYTWVDADLRTDAARNCVSCHSGQSPNLAEYVEWIKDGHSKSFASSIFWTMYMGMDVNRNSSQQTQWGISADGQRVRLASDPTKPDYGPGFHLDYPNDNGNCIYCHVPAGFPGTPQEVNLTASISSAPGVHTNVAAEGVTCDVCHKVTDVALGNDGLPFIDRPGILSMSFLRPGSPGLFFVGPKPYGLIPDMGIKKTCSPVFSESRFCAGCHYRKFSDTEIYGSYKEWLDSSYSKKYVDAASTQENSAYRSCQDCHMLYNQQVEGTLPSQRSACSESNLNFRDFNHNMMNYGPDPTNPAREIPLLVKRAAAISIDEAKLEEGLIKFKVTVRNTGAGHKFPTDSPLRHLILLVQVTSQNNWLPQISGPTIPVWAAQDYAGQPGQIYANLLKDKDTNQMPTLAYWNSAATISDTRLKPGEPVQSEYSFVAPSNGSVVITARLIYRKAFIDIARKKGWSLIDLDIEAASANAVVP